MKFRYIGKSDEVYDYGMVYEGYKELDCYTIISGEDYSCFTINPDEQGLSYKDWFEIVE